MLDQSQLENYLTMIETLKTKIFVKGYHIERNTKRIIWLLQYSNDPKINSIFNEIHISLESIYGLSIYLLEASINTSIKSNLDPSAIFSSICAIH